MGGKGDIFFRGWTQPRRELTASTTAAGYRAPLRWRSSLGGNSRHQQLLQEGNLLLRVHFHPTEKAQAPVAPTEKQTDLQALLPTSGVKGKRSSKPSRSQGSNKGSSSSHSSPSTDSSSSCGSSLVGSHSETQEQPTNRLRDVSEGDGTLQQLLLQQLEELSLAWQRALSEQQQDRKQQWERASVVIDGQRLQEHLQQSPLMGALCTNSFCSNMAGAFLDLYSEEEFRVWGLCSSCQQQLFTTPLPAGTDGGRLPMARLKLPSPFAHCCIDTRHELGITQALAKAAARQEPLPASAALQL
ncbi:LOW QUALITY PROTEIN: uncharacterized protein EMH_0055750 [Eimeria mitis]|uniref:Uncharacterized protein n=1 Tax=Eimeria mitis TaxID=44415 RepID=U6JZH2_9EIME|nr:LOW QUALITY PROTEIN: uncharacterized protein EMH_0055750 [Eimeria mitis]CDJ30156.1 hypothetical protein EMH_0055750 [Eimeria mitis]